MFFVVVTAQRFFFLVLQSLPLDNTTQCKISFIYEFAISQTLAFICVCEVVLHYTIFSMNTLTRLWNLNDKSTSISYISQFQFELHETGLNYYLFFRWIQFQNSCFLVERSDINRVTDLRKFRFLPCMAQIQEHEKLRELFSNNDKKIPSIKTQFLFNSNSTYWYLIDWYCLWNSQEKICFLLLYQV